MKVLLFRYQTLNIITIDLINVIIRFEMMKSDEKLIAKPLIIIKAELLLPHTMH